DAMSYIGGEDNFRQFCAFHGVSLAGERASGNPVKRKTGFQSYPESLTFHVVGRGCPPSRPDLLVAAPFRPRLDPTPFNRKFLLDGRIDSRQPVLPGTGTVAVDALTYPRRSGRSGRRAPYPLLE